MTAAEQVLHSALGLGSHERAEIAHQLLLSLDTTPDEENSDQVWAEEIRRRLESVRSGHVQLSDWDQAYQRMRQSVSRVEGA